MQHAWADPHPRVGGVAACWMEVVVPEEGGICNTLATGEERITGAAGGDSAG